MNVLTQYLMANGAAADNGGVERTSIPDLTGFGITHLRAPFKSSLATIDYWCKIIKSDQTGSEYYVFFDSFDEISLESEVSTTTTPTSTTLADLASQGNFNITSIFCQITGHESVKSANNIASLLTGGDLNVANGKASMYFNGTSSTSFDGSAVTTIDSDVSHSRCIVCTPDAAQSVGVPVSTSVSSTYRAQMYIDKRAARIISLVKDLSDATRTNIYSSTQNNEDPRKLIMTVNPQVEFKSYFNGVLQDTDAFTQTYTNDVYRIGSGPNRTTAFRGDFQLACEFNSELDQTAITNFEAKLNEYFVFT